MWQRSSQVPAMSASGLRRSTPARGASGGLGNRVSRVEAHAHGDDDDDSGPCDISEEH